MLKQIKNLILDMDGVLWKGDTPMPKLAHFFDVLKAQHINFMLATNNASRTPDQYVQKLAKFNVTAETHQIMTSSLATAEHLAQHYNPSQTTAYVIGQDGIRHALQEQGFTLHQREQLDPTANLVVVGLDVEVTYRQLAAATIHIRRGAHFIGCNPDLTFPSEHGQLPGNGSILALLQTATNQDPTIIGKPQPAMFQTCLRRLGNTATRQNTAMVGDRLNTDILGAKNTGLMSILLLSGVTQASQLTPENPIQPDLVFDDIAALAEALA